MMNRDIRQSKFSILKSFGLGPYVMKKIKICENCGQMTKVPSFFCPECHARMTRETLYDKYRKMHTCCPSCDTLLSSDTQYCPHCGKKVMLDDNKPHLREAPR